MCGKADLERAIRYAADNGVLPYSEGHGRDLCWLCMARTPDIYIHGIRVHAGQPALVEMTGRMGLNVDPAACLVRLTDRENLPPSAFPDCERLFGEFDSVNDEIGKRRALRLALEDMQCLKAHIAGLRRALRENAWRPGRVTP